MVRYIHAVLRMALAEALRQGLISRNPADLVRPPRAARPPIATWDASEVQMFLAATEEDCYCAVWRLALHTGMRS